MANEFRQFSEVVGFSRSIASRIVQDKGIVLLQKYFLVDVGLARCVFGYFLWTRRYQQGGHNAEFATYS